MGATIKGIITLTIIISIMTITSSLSIVQATNEGSYIHGLQAGNLTSNSYPELDNYTCALQSSRIIQSPPVTNTTACQDGFFIGWKHWCTNHAINCVGNMTLGYISDIVIKIMTKTHEQYNMGYNAANGSNLNVCPIGENAAFCTGWNNYNDEHNDAECEKSASYSGPFSSHILIGCPLDTINSNQMAKPHALIGTWNYVNGTISGKIVYSDYGNFTLTVPTKNAYGDYKLQGSFGSMGPNILTQCYAFACQNNTLTTT